LTDDLSSFLERQRSLHYSSGQQVDILFDHQDFAVKELSVYVNQGDKKTDLPVGLQVIVK